MGSSKSIERNNFGLSSSGEQDFIPTGDPKFDSWFWESEEKKKMKKKQKEAEIERMRAETAAMQQILAEQDNGQSSGINVGKVALIGGVAILLGIGAIMILKKKNAVVATAENLTTADLIV